MFTDSMLMALGTVPPNINVEHHLSGVGVFDLLIYKKLLTKIYY